MGTTADKLVRLMQTKDEIAHLLESRDFEVDGAPFSAYPEMLSRLGAGGAAESPSALYGAMRPDSWMDMPDPDEDEVYFLLSLNAGEANLIGLTVSCMGQYRVSWGTVSEEQFFPAGSQTLSSGETYTARFDPEDWPQVEGAEGESQVMLRIEGSGITSVSAAPHPDRNFTGFACWPIVDIRGCLPSVERFSPGNTSNAMVLGKLRFFSLEGTNQITDFSQMFLNCYCLMAIRHLYTGRGTSFSGTFQNCYSLQALPELDTSRGTDFSHCFQACYGLVNLPELDFRAGSAFMNTFMQCYCLKNVPDLTGVKIATAGSMFFSCYSLRSIAGLDCSALTSASNAFYYNYALEAFTFSGDRGQYPTTLSLSNANMDLPALEQLVESLPVNDTTVTLNLSGNPGSVQLSEQAKATAREKRWTIVT